MLTWSGWRRGEVLVLRIPVWGTDCPGDSVWHRAGALGRKARRGGPLWEVESLERSAGQ